MQINLQSTPSICSEYVDEHNRKREIMVVISPIKALTSDDGSAVKLISGCNMWKSCRNENCYFSMAARQKKEKSRHKVY